MLNLLLLCRCYMLSGHEVNRLNDRSKVLKIIHKVVLRHLIVLAACDILKLIHHDYRNIKLIAQQIEQSKNLHTIRYKICLVKRAVLISCRVIINYTAQVGHHVSEGISNLVSVKRGVDKLLMLYKLLGSRLRYLLLIHDRIDKYILSIRNGSLHLQDTLLHNVDNSCRLVDLNNYVRRFLNLLSDELQG